MTEMVPLPIDSDVAVALQDDAVCAMTGALVSTLLRARLATDPAGTLMLAIGQLKTSAHRNGLTDALLEDDLRHSAAALRQGTLE